MMKDKLAHLSSEKKRELLRQALQRKEQEPNAGSAFPLSSLQQGLLFISKLYPEQTQYLMPYVFRLTGRLNREALEKSINGILHRHVTLRTVFAANPEGKDEQRVQPAAYRKLVFTDCRPEEQHNRKQLLQNIIQSETSTGFDLSQGPLTRFHLVQMDEEEYVLLFLVHHIVFDGASMDRFVEELRQNYEASVNSMPSPLPALTYTYTAFAQENHSFASKQAVDRQLQFWRNQLAGELPVLDLPTDYKRPVVASGRGGMIECPIPEDVIHSIRQLGQQEGATLYMSLLSVFYILLHRYTRQEDILVGSPFSCRDRSEQMPLIGLLINTVVLRADLSGEPDFIELLRRVRHVALDVISHQDVSFSMVVEAVQPDRRHGRAPLFQVMFTTEQGPGREWDMAGVRGTLITEHQGTSKYELTFVVRESPEGSSVAVEYSSDLFNEQTVQRMAVHYVELLRAAAEQPHEPVARLNMLSLKEREELQQWNSPASLSSQFHSLCRVIGQRSQEDPQHIAIVDPTGFMTYEELNTAADQLALRLHRLQVTAGSVVAICMSRSASMIAAKLAVWKAGAAYLPLDPDHPPDRLAYMVEDAKVPVVITERELSGKLPEGPVLLYADCIDEGWEAREAGSELPAAEGSGHELAYVIYTSGSTGVPKGVGVTHANLANLVDWHQKAYGLSHSDRTSQLAGVSFDAAVWEIWPVLAAGGTIYLADEATRLSPQRLQHWLIDNRINVSFVPTPLAEVLLTLSWPQAISLRAMLTGGDKLHRYPGSDIPFELINHYGPTETTVVATAGVVPKEELAGAPLIGRPIANIRCHILDAYRQPVPVGVPGELYIGGAGVSLGYIFRPDLTEAAFVEAEVGSGQRERLYRTGDLVRYLADGNIEYLGRLDHQVKIRGLRIELGEIETLLAAQPGVNEAVAVTQETRTGELRIVAYIASDRLTPLAEQELKSALRKNLPDYMIPSRIVLMTAFPLTRNGKIDRRALPPADEENLSLEFIAPQNQLEDAVAAIWEEVLGKARISRTDHFFDIGGHSLLLVRVHEQLQTKLHTDMQLLELFQYTTVQQIAGRLAGKQAELPGDEAQEESARMEATEAETPQLTDAVKEEIAVIGLACRVPGAGGADQFWKNLKAGVDSIRWFSREELLESGADLTLAGLPDYVPARGYLEGADLFDAEFFHVPPREAEAMDPQHRIFLENTWEALEHAGYDPARYEGRIGVYAGSAFNTYLLNNLLPNRQYIEMVGMYSIFMNNDKDSLATRTAYKLNLRGPAVTVQTACSTSLVAVHMACQGLIMNDCEIALAGGVTVRSPLKDGYLYREGEISSPAGQCRTFDEDALGTIGGAGTGVVVLKRLSQAKRDGDTIYAVIKGSAINNDGADKIGFTAPGVDGQAEAVSEALRRAGISPETISYVEAHGTGTPLGDPIEVSALTKAYRKQGAQRSGYCALGSVKTNIGHLDAAAGVVGLIKTVLALQNRELPPSLHFKSPNPKIDFANSPFYVNTQLRQWKGPLPLRAGVSALGVGGTNAHLILEQAPAPAVSAPARPQQLIVLSARTVTALDAMTDRLARFLEDLASDELADAAYTLQVGRTEFSCRRIMVAEDAAQAAKHLKSSCGSGLQSAEVKAPAMVVFTFSGEPSQHRHLAAELYRTEPLFQKEVDYCCELAAAWFDCSVLRTWFSAAPGTVNPAELGETERELAVFIESYALAKLWMSWGIQPAAVIAHGIGEYAAGCLAGLFGLQDALKMAAGRREWMRSGDMYLCRDALQKVPAGALKIPVISTVSGAWMEHRKAWEPDYWAKLSVQPGGNAQPAEAVRELIKSPDYVFLEAGSGPALTAVLAGELSERNPRVIGLGAAHSREAEEPVRSSLLAALGKLWLSGAAIRWDQLHTGEVRRRIALPPYPFEHQRFWVEIAERSGTVEETGFGEVAAAHDTLPEQDEELDLASEIQELVVKVWQEVIGGDSIREDDDFFEAGGDSLMASRVVSRVKEIFPIELPLGTLFTYPVLHDFAQQIEWRVAAKMNEMQD